MRSVSEEEMMITRIDTMLDHLVASEFILEEDVAWVAVPYDHIWHIPGVLFTCPVRHALCVKYRGVEFRVSPWVSEGYRPYPVWNLTARTKAMRLNKDSPQAKFKSTEW